MRTLCLMMFLLAAPVVVAQGVRDPDEVRTTVPDGPPEWTPMKKGLVYGGGAVAVLGVIAIIVKAVVKGKK